MRNGATNKPWQKPAKYALTDLLDDGNSGEEWVFSTSKSEEWDGSYQGELVPQGVYH